MITQFLHRPFLHALLLLAATAPLAAQQGSSAPSVDSARIARLRADIRFLAGEGPAGRRTATEGNLLAAKFIADRFKELGLQPLPGGDGYYHLFEHASGVQLGRGRNAVTLRSPGGRGSELRPGAGYNPMGFSDNGTVSGDLVFAGYGITAPDLSYDDYTGIDAKGRIVVIMRHSPDGSNPHGDFARYATFAQKVINAREHEAKGMIFINPPTDPAELISLKLDRNFTHSGIPAISMRSTEFDALRDPAGRSLLQLQQIIDTTRTNVSFAMNGYRAEMSIDVDLRHGRVPNVVAVLPGNDPRLRDEMIVIGGHFDHLGHGGEGSLYGGSDSAIHYGADDNASGTAGVLVLAERFARTGGNRRTLLFMTFNGEEEGLLGSAAFLAHPPVNLEKMVTMMNMDMIGRLDSALIVQGIGTSPGWRELVERENRGRLTLRLIEDGYGPSDYASFYGKGIPVIGFFTGLHKEYHRPTDTWDKVNYEGESRILGYIEDVIRAVDALDQRPQFTKTQSNITRSSTGFRVYVGTIPDYGFEGKGLRLSGVSDGGPAQKAGLKEGDIIVRMGPKSINNIYDYTYALGEFRPKDKVQIEFLRNGATMTTDVELGSR